MGFPAGPLSGSGKAKPEMIRRAESAIELMNTFLKALKIMNN
jgi:hypothetical protein